jgi:hypothetical protein
MDAAQKASIIRVAPVWGRQTKDRRRQKKDRRRQKKRRKFGIR